jgi:hypothetical protein
LTKFVSQNATSIDHTDPSVNTVLTAKSRSHTPHGGFDDGYVQEVKLQENEPHRILKSMSPLYGGNTIVQALKEHYRLDDDYD